ncbi:hypothetical protein AOLI_G00015850 [Acnodon oligacanthus]
MGHWSAARAHPHTYARRHSERRSSENLSGVERARRTSLDRRSCDLRVLGHSEGRLNFASPPFLRFSGITGLQRSSAPERSLASIPTVKAAALQLMDEDFTADLEERRLR